MQILLSPAKTQLQKDSPLAMTTAVYERDAERLARKLKKYNHAELQDFFNISEKQAAEVHALFANFKQGVPTPAFTTYSGAVFKAMKQEEFTEADWQYVAEHCAIFSAMYGLLRATDGVKPYRLDMKASPLEGESLYRFWERKVNKLLDDDVIINVASNEFAKLIQRPHISIDFREERDGQFKRIATYAKMARGQFVAQMVKAKVKDVETIKSLRFDGYVFNPEHSSADVFTFTR